MGQLAVMGRAFVCIRSARRAQSTCGKAARFLVRVPPVAGGCWLRTGGVGPVGQLPVTGFDCSGSGRAARPEPHRPRGCLA